MIDGDENAGTIQSFDQETGRLTIALFGGDTTSGLVTDRTRIKCEDEDAPDVSARASHGENEPDGDNGDNGDNDDGEGPGDDQGDDENDVGANCTTSDLIVGATVEEAALELEQGKAVFEEVELAG